MFRVSGAEAAASPDSWPAKRKIALKVNMKRHIDVLVFDFLPGRVPSGELSGI